MTSFRSNTSRIVKNCFLSAVFLLGLLVTNTVTAQDGKTLFNTNCASCHQVHKNSTGPALAGVEGRWESKEKLYSWIKNSAAFLKTGDAYANKLYLEYNKTAMNLFPNLKNEEIDAILKYVASVPAPGTAVPGDSTAGAPAEDDNSLLFGILSLILAVVAVILLQVNAGLKKLADAREGHAPEVPVPFFRNKRYLAFLAVVFFVIGGYQVSKSAMGSGRSKDYQPVQPIYYSHKVHAGINQINCQYCHTGAYQGKQATIPSLNVCMNCHLAINEYKGEKMFTEDGEEVNGTQEIEKLYKYAGFEPGKPWDPSKAKPIEWVRIHNLPDHVYFNHAQHVKAGQVACQTCHGEIQKMGEVKQQNDLSMGWCINCHRETKVQFKDNGFYSIYEKYHQDLKSGKMDSTKGVTVESIGGTECQKCHY